MRLEFEYSPEDLREAMAVAQLASMRQRGSARYIYWASGAALTFGYGEILSLFVEAHSGSKAMTFIILPLIPLATLLLVLGLGAYFQAAGKTFNPWEAPARKSSPATSRTRRWGRIVVWSGVLIYACVYPLVIERLSGGANDDDTFFDGMLAVVAVASLFTLWAIVTNSMRARSRGVWESNKHLHGRFRIEIDDQNMLISSTQWSSRLRWSAFQGFTETPNLIIVYLSRAAFHMLPKRAIASETDLNELSRILVQYVQHGHLFPRPSAFPVSPIPAIPVTEAQN